MLYKYEPLRNIELEKAWDTIKLSFKPLEKTHVSIRDAYGYVAAEDILSPIDFPPKDISHVEGFAVRLSSLHTLPAKLKLRMSGERVEAGEAVFVRTGEPLPIGAEAVVPVEHVLVEDDHIIVKRRPAPYSEIIGRGSDYRRGEAIVARGERIRHYHIKTLLEAGFSEVPVYRRPRVTVMPTGDEYALGERIESLGPTVCSILSHLGYPCFLHSPLPDDPGEIADALRGALVKSDAVAMIGGSSIGIKDHSWRAAVSIEESMPLFRGLRTQPGKVTSMLSISSKPVVLLPGFVQSNFVALSLALLPTLAVLEGASSIHAHRPCCKAVLDNSLRFNPRYLSYHRIRFVSLSWDDSGYRARVMEATSYMVSPISRAEGFLLIPPGKPSLMAGESVTVHVLPRIIEPRGGV